MVAMLVAKVAEFLREEEAVVDIFRRHKVLSRLDATVQVLHLCRVLTGECGVNKSVFNNKIIQF